MEMTTDGHFIRFKEKPQPKERECQRSWQNERGVKTKLTREFVEVKERLSIIMELLYGKK
jgi:hypothetical protein